MRPQVGKILPQAFFSTSQCWLDCSGFTGVATEKALDDLRAIDLPAAQGAVLEWPFQCRLPFFSSNVQVVNYYVEQSKANNHAVREAACACIAELMCKVGGCGRRAAKVQEQS